MNYWMKFLFISAVMIELVNRRILPNVCLASTVPEDSKNDDSVMTVEFPHQLMLGDTTYDSESSCFIIFPHLRIDIILS
jgi:hypothetical protein